MLDEVAIEPRLRYSSQQDCVVGLAREDSSQVCLDNLSTRPDPLAALLDAKAHLDSGDCHRASEATMAAIARFGQSDYNASVILASPTCKTEKAPEQEDLIRLILKAWRDSPFGEVLHGPVWSVCTDGDARRRLPIYHICMTSKVTPGSDLFSLIGDLPLLNLCCGQDYLTHNGDYKHEEKRECIYALHNT
jgi:hypothetical protein